MTADLVARLAQEIRRVDGSHSLGAGALAEALAPFVEREAASALRSSGEADGFEAAWHKVCDALDYADPDWMMYGPEGADAASALIRKLATPASAWRPKVEDFLRRLATMQPPNVVLQQITMLGEARDLLREAITPPAGTKGG